MSSVPNILICDDDPVVHESLALYLDNDNFTHVDAYDGRESLKMVVSSKPDLILLDVMMPEMSGLDVCRELRKTLTTPIILLTAKGEEIDKILGLELGADDYIVKPFSPREVIARIKAVLRRFGDSPASSSILRFDRLEINLNNYLVKVDGDTIPCTPKEVEILYLLASHPGQVYGRDQILEAVWGYEYNGDSRTVDTHIKRIRQKVICEKASWSIQTIYGVGYKFEVG
ncbi:MAG: response regulator transcription factor [Saccharofermentans sp.]|jgi:DNA-binding response OmpR family regulator|nr:response regulator transcription factor [Mageeibacillus sp.]MCI1263399.1 response regulator transcription factor [Saccharofermentans sp.]MCI1274852.1 response regulator transcription factor [Saccharofermentans sp.]MCI1769068.1 response regulator transcription factor [Mageeibacillus sp.]MCI2044118.1 response regulator transcription factor [Mageeibacillus sp.]